MFTFILKGMNPVISSSYDLNSTTTLFLQGFGIKYSTKVDMSLNKDTKPNCSSSSLPVSFFILK